MLTAVCDKNNGPIVVTELPERATESTEPPGTIASLLRDPMGVLRSTGGDECNGLEDDSVYVEIEEDEPGECEEQLDARVKEVATNGMSQAVAQKLYGLLKRNRPVLGSDLVRYIPLRCPQ